MSAFGTDAELVSLKETFEANDLLKTAISKQSDPNARALTKQEQVLLSKYNAIIVEFDRRAVVATSLAAAAAVSVVPSASSTSEYADREPLIGSRLDWIRRDNSNGANGSIDLAAKRSWEAANASHATMFDAHQRVAKLLKRKDVPAAGVIDVEFSTLEEAEQLLKAGMETCYESARVASLAFTYDWSTARAYEGEPLVETDDQRKKLKEAIAKSNRLKAAKKPP